MPARLLYHDGQGRDAFVDVSESTPLFLGRGTDCAIRTEDALVSRKNSKVSFAAGRFLVEDLGSANGTYVNERRIQKQALSHDDIIRCGSLQIRYVEVAAQPSFEPEAVASESQTRDAEALAAAVADRDAWKQQLEEAKGELESLHAKIEAADSELKRLRAEAVASRDEVAKVKRDAAQDKDELHAITRVAEELKKSLGAAKDEAGSYKAKLDDVTEELAARNRQLERGQEDVQRAKHTMEELRNKLGELQKTKDEGWRELNSQLAQVEHLREVIAEQERILEERRVGLISLDSAAKELRVEKEKVLRELVDMRNARDELKDRLNRAEAKTEGLEEEHRRVARAMNDGGTDSSDEVSRLASELRNLKVEYRKLETDLGRTQDGLARAEAERQALSDQKAKLDVERAQIAEEKKAADTARVRAEEARAKAESMRQRADEEKQQASAARDMALGAAEDLRRSVERGEKKIAELQRALADPPPAPPAPAAEATPPADAPAGAGEVAQVGGSDELAVALRQRAQEVYDGINSALSELRTTVITAKGLFSEVGPKIADEDARRALGDALVDSMERAEDAKGLLRTLKELADG